MRNSIFTLGTLLLSGIIVQAQQLNSAPQQRPQTTSTEVLPSLKNAARIGATCNRETIIENYTTNYLGSAVTTTQLGWTGNVSTCTAGTISATAQTLTFQRINYFRNLVGLTPVTFTNTYDAQTQAAALMMKANNKLDHCVGSPDPCAGFICYSAAGSTGAQNSNLALGAFASGAIKVYMDDPGAGNTAAGHRRWVLYSRATAFGHGSTDASDALWVFGNTANPSTLPQYVAYPTAGYMPRTLIPQRWSFSIPGADFSAATATVTNESNNPVALTVNTVATGYGDNSLVWDLATAPSFSGVQDVVYNVTISGVKIGGVTQNPYQYKVIAIDPTTQALLTVTSSNPNCGQGNTASATATLNVGAKSYLWSNGATTQTISNLAPGTYSVTVTDKNDCTYTQSVTISATTSTTPTVSNNAASPSCAGASITLTASGCSGTYTWNNGLGTGATKTVSPAATTTYSVTCTEGSCAASASATTTVNVTASPTVACIPTASNSLSTFFGVINFTLNTINSTSGHANADGKNYVDKSCISQTTLTAGNSYPMSIQGYFTNTHAAKVYIDFNNNGSFTDAGELVLSGNTSGSSNNNTLAGTLVVPTSAVTNTLLRVRVLADISSASNSCTIVGNSGAGSGQIEDYAITIEPCPAAITSVVNNARCGNGTLTLSAAGCAGTYNWYAANSGGTSLGSASSYTTPPLTSTTTYYVDCTVGSCTSARSAVVATVTTIPNPPTVTNTQINSNQSAVLTASNCAGTVRWFDALTNGNILSTGPSYTTPILTSTTTYYVDCTVNSCTSSTRAALQVTVVSGPSAPSITFSPKDTVCVGVTMTVTAACATGTLVWVTGGPTSSFTASSGAVGTKTYSAKCVQGSTESSVSSKTAVWKAIPITIINIGASQSATKSGTNVQLSDWASQFVTKDAGPTLENSTQANPTIFHTENPNKGAPRFWTAYADACDLPLSGSMSFDMLATPETGVQQSFNTHENNAPYFMYANSEGYKTLYAQNNAFFGFYANNGSGGNLYDAGLPKGLYKLSVRYWDQKGAGIAPAVRTPQGNQITYQEHWFRIQSSAGIGTGAARIANDELTSAVPARVFPNPATKAITLEINNMKNQNVEWVMTDLSGRVIKEGHVWIETDTHREEIEVNQQKEGLYFLKVKGGITQTVLKVMKINSN